MTTEQAYTIVLDWDDEDGGTFGWEGRAATREAAISAARAEMHVSSFDDSDTPAEYPVISVEEGYIASTLPAVLDALRAMRSELDAMSGYWTEHMDTLAQVADQAIAQAEGRPLP